MNPTLAAAALACTAPRVIDGDTLDRSGPRVRVFGIDAPKMHRPSHASVYPDEPSAQWAQRSRRGMWR